jgi:hypothetical protein
MVQAYSASGGMDLARQFPVQLPWSNIFNPFHFHQYPTLLNPYKLENSVASAPHGARLMNDKQGEMWTSCRASKLAP